MLLLALLACGGPITKQSGYSDEFTVPASIQVGTPGENGLVWEAVGTSGRFEGVVVATWCPTCKQLLAVRAADPRMAAATPNLYFLAEEAELQLKHAVDQGQMTPEQAASTQAGLVESGAMVLNPAAIAGSGAKALHWDDVPAKWFPYFFTCNDGVCEGWSGTW
ncbi:MAG: hypothetical protein Q8P41_03365 [Pseudomonadota bacterium]|nr:hypothetical protein [Pseudomonadota bacterium]